MRVADFDKLNSNPINEKNTRKKMNIFVIFLPFYLVVL
jgi:hypothetical protein